MQIGSKEWKEWRRSKIGASDVAAILNISPFQTYREKWEEKVFGVDQFTNASMTKGNEMEEEIRNWFENETGLIVFPKLIEHPKIFYQFATLDGIDMDHKNAVEIKYASKKNHDLAKKGTLPDYYMCQVQHQMHVCELNEMYYCSYTGSLETGNADGVIIKVKRDQDFIDNMNDEEAIFYELMISKTAPPLSERDYKDFSQDDDLIAIVEELRQIQKLSKREDFLREEILRITGNRNAKGSDWKITSYSQKGSVDYGSIPELCGVDLDKHRKQEIRKFRLEV